jgi:hypothetical protein
MTMSKSDDHYEELERDLDPNRDTERRAAMQEAADRLRTRGVMLTGKETSEELDDLLSAVEHFEAAVESRGGDLMVDDLKSTRPDDQHFVLPRREAKEPARAYILRVQEAGDRLRRHPRHPD